MKVPAEEFFETLRRLDEMSPSWEYANEDHLARRSADIMRVGNEEVRSVEMWVLIKDKTEAALIKLSFEYEEFGDAFWTDKRRIKTGYGRWDLRHPGYVFERHYCKCCGQSKD